MREPQRRRERAWSGHAKSFYPRPPWGTFRLRTDADPSPWEVEFPVASPPFRKAN